MRVFTYCIINLIILWFFVAFLPQGRPDMLCGVVRVLVHRGRSKKTGHDGPADVKGGQDAPAAVFRGVDRMKNTARTPCV